MKKFIELIGNRKRILEVGFGLGRLGEYLIKHFDYVGIDNQETYFDYFRAILVKKGYSNVDKILKLCSFEEFNGDGFDVVLFAWSVIWDFGSRDLQEDALKKAKEILNSGGIILLEGPAKGEVYNDPKGFHPEKFYFEDWREKLLSMEFSRVECNKYRSRSGREREIIILGK